LLDLKTRILGRISERQRLGGRFFTTTTAKVSYLLLNHANLKNYAFLQPDDDDTPEFDSNRVMLDIPGELFGTAFSVVTDVSKIVGDVILVNLFVFLRDFIRFPTKLKNVFISFNDSKNQGSYLLFVSLRAKT
jgi:hypothetical protein